MTEFGPSEIPLERGINDGFSCIYDRFFPPKSISCGEYLNSTTHDFAGFVSLEETKRNSKEVELGKAMVSHFSLSQGAI